jgi:pimeloyl-ACP methyl ester carboxylesterase
MSIEYPNRAFPAEALEIPDIAGVEPMRHVCPVGDLELSYLVWGDRAKPPVVLVHGGKDHARNWDWTVKELLADYCVITPDMRGHGDSGRAIGGGYYGHSFVSDFAVFMDHLAEAGFAMPLPLVGHSMGGNIILNYAAATACEKVTRLIAIEGLGASQSMYDKFAATPRAERLQKWVDKRRKIANRAPRWYASPEEMVERMAGVHSNLRADQARHLALHAARQHPEGWTWKHDPYTGFFPPVDMTAPEDYSDVYKVITCPVLLMRGENSWADDPEKDGRIKAFQDARLINYADAGHWLHHDQFDAFIKDVKDFLKTD